MLILYISGGTYSLKSTPNDRFFEKLFMAIFIDSQSFCQKSAERKSPKKYFSYLIWCLAWESNPGFSSNKSTHYLLDHGDFKCLCVSNTRATQKFKWKSAYPGNSNEINEMTTSLTDVPLKFLNQVMIFAFIHLKI